jgi:hypothetical protein
LPHRACGTEEATAYCERHGIAYQVFNPKPDNPRIIPYADNFSFKRTVKTAKALGLTIPLTLLGRADEVIE